MRRSLLSEDASENATTDLKVLDPERREPSQRLEGSQVARLRSQFNDKATSEAVPIANASGIYLTTGNFSLPSKVRTASS